MGDDSRKVWVEVDGERFLVEILDVNQRPIIAIVEGSQFELELDDIEYESAAMDSPNPIQKISPESGSVPGGTVCDLTSPMPGDIVQIFVAPGQVVKTGDPLCVLDAMKMKNTVHAPQDGRIAEVCVKEGQSVEFGAQLFRFN